MDVLQRSVPLESSHLHKFLVAAVPTAAKVTESALLHSCDVLKFVL
jgi:hypothetical protein